MYFHSISFALFLPTAVAGFWFLPQALRKWWLLGVSYLFYMGTFPRYAALLLLVTLVAYFSGLALARWPGHRRLLLWVSISLDLGILAAFKYAELFRSTLASLLGEVGVQIRLEPLAILAPVGLSFYVFIAMSYTIECYRKTTAPVKDFSLFACYLSFFPQLLAGPIVRPGQLLPQLRQASPFRMSLFEQGLRLFILGLFKKVLLADRLAPVVDHGFSAAHTLTALDAWVSVLAFTFQIYFDFSGYTDCARGCAKLFGYELPENFYLPYLSANPREFWRRWHVTLSTWLRDYLYIPLGGNRCSKKRMYGNLMATMALGGLWHGAAWTFLFWGIYHGLLLVLHRRIMELKEAVAWARALLESRAGAVLGRLVTFVLVALGWVVFRARSLEEAGAMYTALTRLGEGGSSLTLLVGSAVPIFAGCLLLYHAGRVALARVSGLYPSLQRAWTWAALAALLVIVAYRAYFCLESGYGAPKPFIYFQF